MSSTNAQPLLLEGDLVLSRITTVHQSLSQQLQKHLTGDLELRWQNVQRVDEAGVQLLQACYLECQRRGQKLQLQSPLPQALQDILQFGGDAFSWNPAPSQ